MSQGFYGPGKWSEKTKNKSKIPNECVNKDLINLKKKPKNYFLGKKGHRLINE